MSNDFGKNEPASVLIVDDNAANCLAVEAIVRPLAEHVCVVNSGKAALEKCASHPFSLVLMDVMMPEMDGIEAARRLRELPGCGEVPVIFLTAADLPHIVSRGYALGLTDFIFKPISAEILRGKLSLFLELYRRSRRLQEALASAQFRSFVDNVADYAIFMMDAGGEIQTWNTGATRILGYSEAEILGKNFSCLFTPEDVTIGAHEEELRLARNHGRAQHDRWMQRHDGTRFWANGSLVEVHDERHGVLGYAKILRDVTEKKISDEKMRLRARELARSNAELQRFTFIASHDLKEPLRQIASYVQLLQRRYEGRLDADADSFISYAVTGVKRIYELIGDLLEYSRVGRIEEPYSAVSCRAAVDAAVAHLEGVHGTSTLSVKCVKLPTVTAMQSALFQLFQQLLGNSLKFRKGDRSVVEIEAERTPTHWLFSLRDDGIGIDPQYSDRIFEVFRRLHSKEEYPGSGIGLAICKKIVERHGGRIWIDAAAHTGATFHFTLAHAPPSLMDLHPEALA